MFAHFAIHQPKPEYKEAVLASMRRVGSAAEGRPGLIRIDGLREIDGNRLVGISMWESMDAFRAASDEIFAGTDNEPWDVWEDVPVDSMFLEY